MCRTILGLWMFLICGTVWKNGPSQPPCQMGWAFRVMQTRAFLVEWLGRISEILRFPCKWKTARHCQGLKDVKYAGQNCAEVMAGEVLGFLFPLQAHDVSTVSMKDIWSWSTMKYWKRLEIAAVLLPCKRSNMEQSLCTVMHIETRQNKAKQMNINLVNTTYTCTTGVTTRHKVCTLPENTVPSTSLRFHRLMATITSKFTLDHPLPLSLSFLMRNCLYGLPDQSPNVWERNGNTSKSPNVHKSSWKLNWPKYQNNSAFQGSKLCDTDMLVLSQETSWCTHLQLHSAKLLLSPS